MPPVHGCCTDSPGCDDIATVRRIYQTLAVALSAAVVAIGVFTYFYH